MLMSKFRRPASSPRRLVAAALVLSACGIASSSFAQVRGSVFTGGEFDQDDAGYLGVQVEATRLGGGPTLLVRGVATGGVYAYMRNDRLIDGRFVGGQIGPQLQWADGSGYLDVGVAARFVDTRLQPRDPFNRRRGGVGDALFNVDGDRRFGRWEVTGYAEFGTGIEDYLTRASLTHDVSPRWRVGPEVILQGDPTYDRQRGGLLAAVRFSSSSELRLSVGGGRQSGRGADTYGTVAFTHNF